MIGDPRKCASLFDTYHNSTHAFCTVMDLNYEKYYCGQPSDLKDRHHRKTQVFSFHISTSKSVQFSYQHITKVFNFYISTSQKCLVFILAHHKSVWFSYQHITKCFSRAAGRGNHLHQHSILTQSLKSGLFEPCCPSSNHTECWPCISISRQSLIAVVLYCLCQQSRILIHHWFVFAPAKQIEKKTCLTRIVKHN